MKPTLLIDGDTFVYEAALVNEVATDWGEDLWTLHSHLGPTIAHFDSAIERLREKLDADKIVLALSDYTDPWRKEIMPTYKANRKKVRRPITFAPLREYAHEKYTTYQRPGLEGDDVLGILLTSEAAMPGPKILVSLDKDMKTLPGEHYNHQKDARFSVSEHEANYSHMMQTLTGDTTDGYPGCPGVGPKGAEKILLPALRSTDEETLFSVQMAWPLVVAAYSKQGLSEEVALMNARVARICRSSDFDFTNKRVRLWEPPKEG